MTDDPANAFSTRHDVDILVIGGGQSGLAAGYYLQRLRRDADRGRGGPAPGFAILDAGTAPGGAWRDYWDTLELFSPAEFSSLPGHQMPQWAGPGNPPAPNVVDYLADYEARYDLPVHRPVRALGVRAASGGGFTTATDRGEWSSRVVVSATGTWGAPHRPNIPGAAGFRGRQLHTTQYPGRTQFAGQRVVVVGGANSGAQIAADLAPVASVTWVTRRPPRYLPDEVDGRELFRIATRHARAVARGEDSTGGVASLGDIVAVPAVRRARDAGLLDALPMFSRFTATGVQWDDGRRQDADVVVWCTGFRPDLGHLEPLSLGGDGAVPATGPALATASSSRPGLFFLGYGDWCGPASATLIGVGAMARDTIAAAVRALPAAGAARRPESTAAFAEKSAPAVAE